MKEVAAIHALARQSVVHHRRREEHLERLLADLLAHGKKKCRCGACKALRTLAASLEDR